jgi:hypothetical protein
MARGQSEITRDAVFVLLSQSKTTILFARGGGDGDGGG